MKTFNQFNEEQKKPSGKILFKKKVKSGEFQVRERDTAGMKGKQDKFNMMIVKNDKIVKDIGTHPSLEGAKKFVNKIK